MKSLAVLTNLWTSLSLNATATNAALGQQLMTDQQRFLLQKYFDNEKTYQTTTVGGQTLASTATIATAAVSATLTASWSYPTVTQLVNFSNGNQRSVLFTNGSTGITWVGGLTSSCTTVLTTVGVQAYAIPANISKIINNTITIGQLRFLPSSVMSRDDWDRLNTLPYTSDIPNQFFIYNGNMEFWPIPSSTGNLITFNYKTRIPDFSSAFIFSDTSGTAYSSGATAYDYQAGSLASIVAGSTAITGTSTSWNTTGKYPLNTDVSFYNLFLVIPQPNGDGYYYPISKFTSDTALTLKTPIQNAPSATAPSHGYSIAQLPLLFEDFHNLIVYGALMVYFSAIVPDANRFKQYQTLYQQGILLLEDYIGTKSIQIDLGGEINFRNPNLYFYPTS